MGLREISSLPSSKIGSQHPSSDGGWDPPPLTVAAVGEAGGWGEEYVGIGVGGQAVKEGGNEDP